MLSDLLNSLQRDGAITEAVSLRTFARILSDTVAFVTSSASSMEGTSLLSVTVNSDISGEAGALAALPDEGGGGGGGVMGEK